MKKNFDADFSERMKRIPEPVYDPEPQFLELYRKAWELAAQHVRHIPGLPQETYMDEAFCATQIWIWDTCFMALFCKYAPDVFPGVESLHNFYDILHAGRRYPEVITPENEPEWTGGIPGKPFPVHMHIADNPPLFAWAEYENALFTGDTEHLRTLLLKEQYLQKHYFWLENLKETFHAEWLTAPTCWVHHKNGYAWEGGRSGMDNTPRGRIGDHSDKERPATSDLLWLDALAQQSFAAECIGKLFALIGETEQTEIWFARAKEKAVLLREKYWDPDDGIFYDIFRHDESFCRVPTIASFWPMAAGAATQEQAEIMTRKLDDPDYFGGIIPFTSLARKDGDFHAHGGYWRGSVWIPTAYMTAYALHRYGKQEEARRHARTLLRDMAETFRANEPHTIWECYDPLQPKPACTTSNKTVRKDFCGWSALAPISMFIECVIGISHVDAFRNEICWTLDRTLSGKVGIRNLRFGETTVSMIAHDQVCEVETDHPFTLILNDAKFSITAGKQILNLQTE